MTLWHTTQGQGPDLVMLHGWSQNAGVWHSVAPALQDQYRITLIELPGHGASPIPDRAYELDAWVEAVLDAAPAQAAWLGWSLGGLIAQRAALLAPERVHCLCLAATAPRFVEADDWPHGVTLNNFQQFADTLFANPETTMRRFFALQVQGGEQQKSALSQLVNALSQRPKANILGLKAGLHVLLNTDLRADLCQLSMPSTWLWGSKDTIATASMADAVMHLSPGSSKTVLNKAAHAPFISHPQESMAWLQNGLEKALVQ